MMDRLQKKCVIASVTFHGALILILLFGSALVPSPTESNFKPITVYDATKVSDLLTQGGQLNPTPPVANPQPDTKPTPPVPRPEPPVARATPEPVRRVEPKADVEPPKAKPVEENQDHWYTLPWNRTKTDTTKDNAVDATPPKGHHKIVLDSTDVKRTKRTGKDTSTSSDDSEANARAAQRRAANAFASSLRNISKNLSSATIVSMPTGDGSGGEVSVNYRDIIASKYYNAWVAPSDLDDASMPVVMASVTIARDGTVVSARIVEPSGNRAMDRSIQNALDNVRFIEPFPESSKDQERTVTIKFSLRTKRQIG